MFEHVHTGHIGEIPVHVWKDNEVTTLPRLNNASTETLGGQGNTASQNPVPIADIFLLLSFLLVLQATQGHAAIKTRVPETVGSCTHKFKQNRELDQTF